MNQEAGGQLFMPAAPLEQQFQWPEHNRLRGGAAGHAELRMLDALGGPLQVEDEITVRREGSPGLNLEMILAAAPAMEGDRDILRAELQRSGTQVYAERLARCFLQRVFVSQ